jgi:NAD(P)-dependent dehydrogenase (short-subunit alcohol dehydrogenase family)
MNDMTLARAGTVGTSDVHGTRPCGPGRALVTGAASGIGRATVIALLRDGWSVVALDRDDAGLDALREVAGEPGTLVCVAVDLTSTREIETVVERLPQDPPLRGLVNCAAIGINSSFLDTSLDALRSLFDLNFMATFALCQVAARRMAAHDGGSIVNVTSVSGLRANAGRCAYGSSKAALEMLSKVMALELAPLGIRVNTLAPGPTLTAMANGMHLGEESARLLRAVPQGRYATPEEIAEGAAFLLDERRAAYVTGHTLCVDGGMYGAGGLGAAPSGVRQATGTA